MCVVVRIILPFGGQKVTLNDNLMPPYNPTHIDNPKEILKMTDNGLPIVPSEQRLVNYEREPTPPPGRVLAPQVTRRQIISVVVLCYVNLINYMDRFTIAGKNCI